MRILHAWECLFDHLDVVPHGTCRSDQENVQFDSLDGDRIDAFFLRSDISVSVLLEEEGSHTGILSVSIFGDDMVLPQLHPIRSRRRQENIRDCDQRLSPNDTNQANHASGLHSLADISSSFHSDVGDSKGRGS